MYWRWLFLSALAPRYKKQKVSISRYLFASLSCGEGGILDQFVQDSYLLYMCLILQIIRSTMGCWGELSALLPSQSSHSILSLPHRCNFFRAKMHQKRPYLHPYNPLITNKRIIILLTHAFSLERFFPISHSWYAQRDDKQKIKIIFCCTELFSVR